jgi:actin-related protein
VKFSNQRISDENREYIRELKIMKPPLYQTPAHPTSCTTDDLKSCSLFYLGGESEDERDLSYFAFQFQGELWYFKMRSKTTGHVREHLETTWRLESIEKDGQSVASSRNLIATYKDALMEYEYAGGSQLTYTHSCKFEF